MNTAFEKLPTIKEQEDLQKLQKLEQEITSGEKKRREDFETSDFELLMERDDSIEDIRRTVRAKVNRIGTFFMEYRDTMLPPSISSKYIERSFDEKWRKNKGITEQSKKPSPLELKQKRNKEKKAFREKTKALIEVIQQIQIMKREDINLLDFIEQSERMIQENNEALREKNEILNALLKERQQALESFQKIFTIEAEKEANSIVVQVASDMPIQEEIISFDAWCLGVVA